LIASPVAGLRPIQASQGVDTTAKQQRSSRTTGKGYLLYSWPVATGRGYFSVCDTRWRQNPTRPPPTQRRSYIKPSGSRCRRSVARTWWRWMRSSTGPSTQDSRFLRWPSTSWTAKASPGDRNTSLPLQQWPSAARTTRTPGRRLLFADGGPIAASTGTCSGFRGRAAHWVLGDGRSSARVEAAAFRSLCTRQEGQRRDIERMAGLAVLRHAATPWVAQNLEYLAAAGLDDLVGAPSGERDLSGAAGSSDCVVRPLAPDVDVRSPKGFWVGGAVGGSGRSRRATTAGERPSTRRPRVCAGPRRPTVSGGSRRRGVGPAQGWDVA
jgi:hypothetical protein